MRVYFRDGIRVQDSGGEVVLDPKKRMKDSVVSHGHLDHLSPGAVMTRETLEVMKIRLKKEDGHGVGYGEVVEVGGLDVSLLDAGHVFGSAMIKVGDALYSGDVNPRGGPTCGTCQPEESRYLILEATYGKPNLTFPPKDEVINDLLSWMEVSLESGPVVLGAYEFGKAQELLSVANRLDVPVVVDEKIARLAEIYRSHGQDLNFVPQGEAGEEQEGPHVLIVPTRGLRRPGSPAVREALKSGGRAAFASGWCTVYDFSRSHAVDAQFPLSDHGDFNDLLWFVEECNPKQVYTWHGYAQELARWISRSGRRAETLGKGWF